MILVDIPIARRSSNLTSFLLNLFSSFRKSLLFVCVQVRTIVEIYGRRREVIPAHFLTIVYRESFCKQIGPISCNCVFQTLSVWQRCSRQRRLSSFDQRISPSTAADCGHSNHIRFLYEVIPCTMWRECSNLWNVRGALPSEAAASNSHSDVSFISINNKFDSYSNLQWTAFFNAKTSLTFEHSFCKWEFYSLFFASSILLFFKLLQTYFFVKFFYPFIQSNSSNEYR